MKIMLANNFYYNRGGDCTYLFSLKKLLEQKGHEVILFSMHHPLNFESEYSKYFVSYINYDEEVKSKSFTSGIKVLKRTIYSQEAKKQVEELIKKEKPDLVHLQNIHHHITPSVFYVFKKYNIPIVWTLHDFTLICPNTSFIANGQICEKCNKRNYFWPSIVRCKKGSFGASSMAAVETVLHRIMMVNDMINVFITPSIFMKKKLEEYGFAENRIKHISNFVTFDNIGENGIDEEDYYLYVGRISSEKGIKTLIDAAIKANMSTLKIVGDGPLLEEMVSYVKSKNVNNIEFLGYKERDDVMNLIQKSRFAVSPSECYENFPYSVLEAFACGKPVIGTRVGGIPEIIKNWENGLLFEYGDSDELSLKIRFLINHPQKAREMGEKARLFTQNELVDETHYNKLFEIYKEVTSK